MDAFLTIGTQTHRWACKPDSIPSPSQSLAHCLVLPINSIHAGWGQTLVIFVILNRLLCRGHRSAAFSCSGLAPCLVSYDGERWSRKGFASFLYLALFPSLLMKLLHSAPQLGHTRIPQLATACAFQELGWGDPVGILSADIDTRRHLSGWFL